jgi:hypothetical protein
VTRRLDAHAFFLSAALRQARVEATRDLKNLASAFHGELDTLRAEVKELKAERERERAIECAQAAERDGRFWLQ